MPQYIYEAIDPSGQPNRGEISAANVAEAVAALESQGLSIQSISAVTHGGGAVQSVTTNEQAGPVGPTEASLDRHFDAIIERRGTILPALRALVSELPAGRAKREIEQLIEEVSRAGSGTELRQSENAIRWLPLLASGFSADTTTRRLSDLIAYATRDLQIRSERRRLFAYPVFVMLVVMTVFGLLCLLVVPVFDNMFTEFGLRLPAPTRVLIGFARQFREHPIQTLMTICGIAGAIYLAVRLWTHFAITTRLFGFASGGNTSNVSTMSSLTGQLAELLQVGVSTPDAIWIAGHGCDHYYFKKASEQLARDAFSQARPLGQSRVARSFPANLIHALDVNQGRPNIPLLRELSELYAQRVNRRVDWSTGAMVQISIVLLGAAVAFLVIALFAPLLTLISGLS